MFFFQRPCIPVAIGTKGEAQTLIRVERQGPPGRHWAQPFGFTAAEAEARSPKASTALAARASSSLVMGSSQYHTPVIKARFPDLYEASQMQTETSQQVYILLSWCFLFSIY